MYYDWKESEKQNLIDSMKNLYSHEDIFEIGRNIEIDKNSYWGPGMTMYQLVEQFVTKTFQMQKQEEMLRIITTNNSLKRNFDKELKEIIQKIGIELNSKDIFPGKTYTVIINDKFVDDTIKDFYNLMSYCDKKDEIIYDFTLNDSDADLSLDITVYENIDEWTFRGFIQKLTNEGRFKLQEIYEKERIEDNFNSGKLKIRK